MPASRTSRRCNHLAATALTHVDQIAGSTVVVHILLKYSVFPLPKTFTYYYFSRKKNSMLLLHLWTKYFPQRTLSLYNMEVGATMLHLQHFTIR